MSPTVELWRRCVELTPPLLARKEEDAFLFRLRRLLLTYRSAAELPEVWQTCSHQLRQLLPEHVDRWHRRHVGATTYFETLVERSERTP